MARRHPCLLVQHLRGEEQWIEDRVMRWLEKLHRRPEDVRFLMTEGAVEPIMPPHGQVLTLSFTDGSEVRLHLFQLTDAERRELLERVSKALSILEVQSQPDTRDPALAAARQALQLLQDEVEVAVLPKEERTLKG
ncbi:hypothetical protein KDA_75460 [Dictyobacter alpinus]|uniref:Uncharacterized protein n=1 Tax=Dictyobacter alpinus TaxID=2014873 RepID=A0A402BL53_9CHLR|nr:hypothetical protein [Dictyobacter alpinus]GCE32062.1 hypothetical protein KDA_75460 [Dictyobacter alpinus]